MIRCWIVAVGLFATVLAARAEDKDPVKEKLFAAKVAYDKDMAAFRKAAGEWLDKREDAARKAGDKKALDAVKADRTTFEEDASLPKTAPADLASKRAAARKALEAAYTQAVKDYVKAKNDDAAAAVEKEWEEIGNVPVDLLALVDTKAHAVKGEWRRDGKSLVGSKGGRLQLPYEPGAEYTVEATLRRGAGVDGFCVGLVAGDRQVLAVIDSWPTRGYVAGLELVDRKEVADNITTVKGQLLKGDKPHTVVCAVRAERVVVSVNGKPAVEFKGELGRLSLHENYTVPNKNALFLHLGPDTTFAIDRLTVTPVKGKGKIVK